MSCNWRLECSCGSAQPDEFGMNHADGDLLAILDARPQILALCSAGIAFSIEVCGKYMAISSEWFVTHNGDGHVIRLIDENGRIMPESARP